MWACFLNNSDFGVPIQNNVLSAGAVLVSLIFAGMTFYNQDLQESLWKVNFLYYSRYPSIYSYHLFPAGVGMLPTEVLCCMKGWLEQRVGGTRRKFDLKLSSSLVSNWETLRVHRRNRSVQWIVVIWTSELLFCRACRAWHRLCSKESM